MLYVKFIVIHCVLFVIKIVALLYVVPYLVVMTKQYDRIKWVKSFRESVKRAYFITLGNSIASQQI